MHADRDVLWRADGTCFPVEAWSHPVWRDQKLVGGVVTFIDITEREVSQNPLRAAHAESELFINSVPSILIGLDGEGRIIRWNSAAARTFDLKDADVQGKSLATCGIRWSVHEMEEKINSLLTKQGHAKWDNVYFEKENQQRLLGLTATKITLSDTGDGMFLIVGAEITDRRKGEEELRSKTAFLEAQTNATLDGILVVDENSNKLLQNRRFVEMFNIPQWICDESHEKTLLEHILPEIKNPEEFIQKVQYINSHRNETIRDEVGFKNGRVFDRYSSPIIGKEGTHYGRIWTFREITERKRSEDAVRQLSLAVEQSPVSILITDLLGNITYVKKTGTNLVIAEVQTLGCSHAEVAAYLLSLWGLPDNVIEGVAWHHHPSESMKSEFSTVVATHAASIYDEEQNPYWLIDSTALDLEYLGRIGFLEKEKEWRCNFTAAPPTA